MSLGSACITKPFFKKPKNYIKKMSDFRLSSKCHNSFVSHFLYHKNSDNISSFRRSFVQTEKFSNEKKIFFFSINFDFFCEISC